jgi:hypothetical protein
MSWITWVAILVVWPLVGLGVAYLFGRFTHRGEISGNAGQLASPVVSYLRRSKRVKVPASTAHNAKGRREANGGRRAH